MLGALVLELVSQLNPRLLYLRIKFPLIILSWEIFLHSSDVLLLQVFFAQEAGRLFLAELNQLRYSADCLFFFSLKRDQAINLCHHSTYAFRSGRLLQLLSELLQNFQTVLDSPRLIHLLDDAQQIFKTRFEV